MISSADIARPLPPAKARRVTANVQAKAGPTDTPPPAYNSPFSFPSSRHGSVDIRRDILGSPMESTYRIMDWESSGHGHTQESGREGGEMSGSSKEEMEWINERSKEELEELFFKADGLIRERENELGRASSVLKNLYDSNVTLKSKHDALLARIPMSPVVSNASPDDLRPTRSNSGSLSYSSSEPVMAQQGTIKNTRKVSIAFADLSMLEDQNAELLDKLEQLKEEAGSSDLAGRRELKRLEREITILREALEKTQAKSEELEEKVKDTQASDALRKKREREERFRARKGVGRVVRDEAKVMDFAPGGSSFGGPSTSISYHQKSREVGTTSLTPANSQESLRSPTIEHPEHALISQLLSKVKELEDTNTRILEQQQETTSQLHAVQRDTLNMSKVYEILAEQDSVDIEMERAEGLTPTKTRIPNDEEFQIVRFRSLRKSIENSLNKDGPYQPDLHFARNRKTVLGLFDEGAEEGEGSRMGVGQSRSESMLGWSEAQEHSSWSASLSSNSLVMSPQPGSLSPLHVFSPLASTQSLPSGPTLMNELENKLGQGSWEMEGQPPHLRNSSLYDFSQFSMPPTPSPASRVPSRETSEGLGTGRSASAGSDSVTPQNKNSNTLQLSVEPPTPERHRERLSQVIDVPPIEKIASPRLQLISETLRSRKHRWDERRLRERRSTEAFSLSTPNKGKHIQRIRSTKDLHTKRPGLTQSLSDAVENMIDDFQTQTISPAKGVGLIERDDESEVDEWDFVDAQSDEDPESNSRATTPQREMPPAGNPVGLQVNAAVKGQGQVPAKSGDSTSLLLQAWMWFQFLIVVFVFLFAMARRGPQSVLTHGGQVGDRKAIAGKR